MKAETAGYVLAAFILVVGGALLRTIILNWVSGPVIVVTSVMLTTAIARRWENRK